MRIRSGQALIELGIGLLTLAILVTVLSGFAVYIVRSLKAQNTVRAGAAEGNGSVDVQIFYGQNTVETLKVKERVQMPELTVTP